MQCIVNYVKSRSIYTTSIMTVFLRTLSPDSDGDGDGGSRRSAWVRPVTRRSQRGEGQVHVFPVGQRRRLHARLQRRSQVKPATSVQRKARIDTASIGPILAFCLLRDVASSGVTISCTTYKKSTENQMPIQIHNMLKCCLLCCSNLYDFYPASTKKSKYSVVEFGRIATEHSWLRFSTSSN